jgi:AcrR family transcriptional regulator
VRERLLDAAAELFLERGYHGVGLDELGQAAGVSRQTVYNLFGSKAGLLTAMTAHVEERAGLVEMLATVRSQPNGLSMLRAFLDTVVAVEPRVRPYSSVVYAARLGDATAAELWRNRLGSRYMGVTMVMSRINDEGGLRGDVTVEEAADVMWAITSPHYYEYLVIERGWSSERYRSHLEEVIASTLLAPSRKPQR